MRNIKSTARTSLAQLSELIFGINTTHGYISVHKRVSVTGPIVD